MRVGNLPGIRRLPMYLTLLRRCRERGQATISAVALAQLSGLVASVVRKDIEMTGAVGTTGIGFAVDALIADIEAFLGWDNPNDAVLVGAGSLGATLLGYAELREQGLNIVAAFDIDPGVIGRRIHGVEVLPMDKLPSLPERLHLNMAVLTVTAGRAQEVADLLVREGITRIWSFAPELLRVPDGVTVQREDISAGLAELLIKSAR